MTAVATRRTPAGARMLDALGVAVCLVDGRELLYVNPAFERLTGWSADAALGRGLESVLGTAAGEAERPGRSVVAIRRPDGSSLRCELTFTEAGGCWAAVLFEAGADEAALIETVLRVERDRAQAYLDVAHAVVVLLYADGTIGRINRHARQVLGDPADELVGSNWIDTVVPPEDRAQARESFARAGGRERERHPLRGRDRHAAAGNGGGSPGRRRR